MIVPLPFGYEINVGIASHKGWKGFFISLDNRYKNVVHVHTVFVYFFDESDYIFDHVLNEDVRIGHQFRFKVGDRLDKEWSVA